MHCKDVFFIPEQFFVKVLSFTEYQYGSQNRKLSSIVDTSKSLLSSIFISASLRCILPTYASQTDQFKNKQLATGLCWEHNIDRPEISHRNILGFITQKGSNIHRCTFIFSSNVIFRLMFQMLSEPVAADPHTLDDQLSRAKTLNNEFVAQGRLIDNAKHVSAVVIQHSIIILNTSSSNCIVKVTVFYLL